MTRISKGKHTKTFPKFLKANRKHSKSTKKDTQTESSNHFEWKPGHNLDIDSKNNWRWGDNWPAT